MSPTLGQQDDCYMLGTWAREGHSWLVLTRSSGVSMEQDNLEKCKEEF